MDAKAVPKLESEPGSDLAPEKSENRLFLKVSRRYLFLVGLLLAWVIFISFLYRSMMMFFSPHLQSEFILSFSALSCIAAASPLTFAVMELYLPPLMHKVAPKWLLFSAFMISLIGIIAFGFSGITGHFLCARIILAVGMSMLFPLSWFFMRSSFHSVQIARVVFVLFLLSAITTVIIAIPPLRQLMIKHHWRYVTVYIASIFLLTALLILALLPAHTVLQPPIAIKTYVDEVKEVMKSRHFWRVAPLASLCLGLHCAIASTVWMMEVQGLSGEDGAIITLFASGLLFSLTISLDSLSKIASRIGAKMNLLFGVVAVIFIVLQVLMAMDLIYQSIFSWAVFFALGGLMFVIYTTFLSSLREAPHLSYISAAFNILFFLVTAMFQIIFGWMFDLWIEQRAALISLTSFMQVLWIPIILELIGFLWFCRKQPLQLQEQSDRLEV